VHMTDPYIRVDRPLCPQLRLDRSLRSAHSSKLPRIMPPSRCCRQTTQMTDGR
jgi:hypothetical protein